MVLAWDMGIWSGVVGILLLVGVGAGIEAIFRGLVLCLAPLSIRP